MKKAKGKKSLIQDVPLEQGLWPNHGRWQCQQCGL